MDAFITRYLLAEKNYFQEALYLILSKISLLWDYILKQRIQVRERVCQTAEECPFRR